MDPQARGRRAATSRKHRSRSAMQEMAMSADKSEEETIRSNALDLGGDVFTGSDPKAIAASLKRSAEQSGRRRATPFRSAMSMLTFHINRAGKDLDPEQRRVLEAAKDELRAAFGKAPKE
jgi:hypothetical protein